MGGFTRELSSSSGGIVLVSARGEERVPQSPMKAEITFRFGGENGVGAEFPVRKRSRKLAIRGKDRFRVPLPFFFSRDVIGD